MARIVFDQVTMAYPGGVQAIDDLSLEIGDGEFMVFVGPSGCGKTTALRSIAGLEQVTSGTVAVGDRIVNDLPPKDRDIAMVFQNYALYPHMTVADNMGFALKISGMNKDEMRKRVEEAAKILDLTQYLERKPKALSGGQRQRVAMGRAIVRNPQVFCMDEPLSNLDAKMRVQTRTDIARLQADLGVTTVYVTHDQIEAMTMGDRVAVMDEGIIQQVDTPLRLYDKPANLFVAGFIGSPQMNLLAATAADGVARVGTYDVPLGVAAGRPFAGDVTIGVRPEAWRLVGPGEGLPVHVSVVEELGADGYVYGTCDVAGTPTNVVVRVAARTAAGRGEVIHVTTDPAHVHVFDTGTGERLSD